MTTFFLESTEKFHITRAGTEFTAWLGHKEIGRAFITIRGDSATLDAIDIYDQTDEKGPNYQRQGYGTKLMQYIAKYLKATGIKTLHSSNEGSGTVQMLDRVFGRENVQHFHGGQNVSYDQAVHVMDKLYGYTGSKVKIK